MQTIFTSVGSTERVTFDCDAPYVVIFLTKEKDQRQNTTITSLKVTYVKSYKRLSFTLLAHSLRKNSLYWDAERIFSCGKNPKRKKISIYLRIKR